MLLFRAYLLFRPRSGVIVLSPQPSLHRLPNPFSPVLNVWLGATSRPRTSTAFPVSLARPMDTSQSDCKASKHLLAFCTSTQPATAGIEEVDAVVCTLGGTTADPRVDSEGNINVIDAAIKKGVKKFILVTSVGCGNSKDAPGEHPSLG